MKSAIMSALLLLGGCSGVMWSGGVEPADDPPGWLYTGDVSTVRVYGEFQFPARDGWCYEPWGWSDVDASGTCNQEDNVGFVALPDQGDSVMSGPHTTPLGYGYLDLQAADADYTNTPFNWEVAAYDPSLFHNLEAELGGQLAWSAKVMGGPADAKATIDYADSSILVTISLAP